MVSFSFLNYNEIQCGCKEISGKKYKIAQNCLAHMLDFIVIQISRANHEKSYFQLTNLTRAQLLVTPYPDL